MNQESDEFIPTRKSLLSRLKNWDDSASWRDFFNTYWRLIYTVALKAGLTHTESQDVVQETMLGVAKSIGEFKYEPARASFKSWLMQVTRHRIANQFVRRKRHPLPQAEWTQASRTPLLDRVPDTAAGDLETIWDTEWEKNLTDAALRRVKHRVPIQQYQIFDFFVLKNWPARKVAQTLGVSVAHVYVAKHRITKLIRKEAELLQRRTL